jgi:hypothetical protein
MRDFLILAVGALFGLGATVSGMVGPTYLSLPPWAQHWLFWGGIAVMALMGLDALCLFFFKPAPLTATFGNLAFLFVLLTLISHYTPAGKSDVDPIEGSIFLEAQNGRPLPNVMPAERKLTIFYISPELLAGKVDGLNAISRIVGNQGDPLTWMPQDGRSRTTLVCRC